MDGGNLFEDENKPQRMLLKYSNTEEIVVLHIVRLYSRVTAEWGNGDLLFRRVRFYDFRLLCIHSN